MPYGVEGNPQRFSRGGRVAVRFSKGVRHETFFDGVHDHIESVLRVRVADESFCHFFIVGVFGHDIDLRAANGAIDLHAGNID